MRAEEGMRMMEERKAKEGERGEGHACYFAKCPRGVINLAKGEQGMMQCSEEEEGNKWNLKG